MSDANRIFGRTGLIIGALLLCMAASLTFNITKDINIQRQYKNDLAEINNIKYELLNPEIWVNKIFGIISKRIDEFEINTENREAIRESIANIIDEVIITVDGMIRRQNSGSSNILIGVIKQLVMDILFDIKSLRQYVPRFTDIALQYLNQPSAQHEIKEIIKEKLNELAKSTFSQVDMTLYDNILKKYACSDAQHCQNILSNKINALENKINTNLVRILIVSVMIFCLGLIKNNNMQYQVWILFLSCIVLLSGGISSPMIEIEAEIAELSFTLFGESVIFRDQAMYYQNKSIFDVVSILIATRDLKMLSVGILITLFSIIFPTLKLISSLIYFYNIGDKGNNPIVRFFALKSGKWSMADVMVVAIFMAFIGFDGIIGSQLSQLGDMGRHIDVLSTESGTHLLSGFYLFLGFCMASLVFSAALERSTDIRRA